MSLKKSAQVVMEQADLPIPCHPPPHERPPNPRAGPGASSAESQATLRQGQAVAAEVSFTDGSQQRERVTPSLVHGPDGQSRISLGSGTAPHQLPGHVNRPQDTVAENAHFHYPSYDAPGTYLIC